MCMNVCVSVSVSVCIVFSIQVFMSLSLSLSLPLPLPLYPPLSSPTPLSQDAEGLKFGLWNALKTYKHYKESWKKIMKRKFSPTLNVKTMYLKVKSLYLKVKVKSIHLNP